MGIRLKLFLLFVSLSVVPMILLSMVSYVFAMRSVERQLLQELDRRASGVASGFADALKERQEELNFLSRTASLKGYLDAYSTRSNNGRFQPPSSASGINLPPNLISDLTAFFISNKKYVSGLTVYGSDRERLFRVEPESSRTGEVLRFQEDQLPTEPKPDPAVWQSGSHSAVCSDIQRDAFGALMHCSIPVLLQHEEAGGRRSVLIADFRLDPLFAEAVRGTGETNSFLSETVQRPLRQIIVVDKGGSIVYHTNDALKHRRVLDVMPAFKSVADGMIGGRSGVEQYRASDEHLWMALYGPLEASSLSVAALGDLTAASSDALRASAVNLSITVLVALTAALLLTLIVGRTAQSIERVSRAAVEIAQGNLDQRIAVQSTDETRGLVESFNTMADQLRELIAREAEAQQFQSFVRLSAMLSHDLKNAIASLSLVVRNLENQFDREDFRADAMESLTAATERLRGMVEKLTDPLKSISGEHERPRTNDLVPLIKNVVTRLAGESPTVEVEMDLPDQMFAMIDVERIEIVIENLVINALEAMGEGGGKLTVKAGLEGNTVFFTVADTGPGVPKTFKYRDLFKPFATTKKKGVGLGLYICREIVEAHGGKIEAVSGAESGARFRVVLPSVNVVGQIQDS